MEKQSWRDSDETGSIYKDMRIKTRERVKELQEAFGLATYNYSNVTHGIRVEMIRQDLSSFNTAHDDYRLRGLSEDNAVTPAELSEAREVLDAKGFNEVEVRAGVGVAGHKLFAIVPHQIGINSRANEEPWRELFEGLGPYVPPRDDEQASVGESGEISGGREDIPLDTSEGFRYPEEVVSDLTYNSYAFNRSESPEVTVEDWEAIFGPTTHAMEQRYQSEFDEWQK